MGSVPGQLPPQVFPILTLWFSNCNSIFDHLVRNAQTMVKLQAELASW